MSELNLKELLLDFKNLKTLWGEDLLALILGVDKKSIRNWTKIVESTEMMFLPNETQRQYIAALLEVYAILSPLPVLDQKNWLVSFSEFYLYGFPAEEFLKRPSDVRMAALMKVTGREDGSR